jgi:hypothetical protein
MNPMCPQALTTLTAALQRPVGVVMAQHPVTLIFARKRPPRA